MLPPNDDKREFALEMLSDLRKRQDQIRYHKLFYARIAHDNGASYEEIGRAFDVTGAAIRMMLKRAGEEAVA